MSEPPSAEHSMRTGARNRTDGKGFCFIGLLQFFEQDALMGGMLIDEDESFLILTENIRIEDLTHNAKGSAFSSSSSRRHSLGNPEIDSLSLPRLLLEDSALIEDKGSVRASRFGQRRSFSARRSPGYPSRERNRSVERGKGCKNGREDLVRLFKFHFGFGRVDIGIHRRGGKAEKEDDHRKSSLGNDMAVGFKDRPVNRFIPHKALIHIEIDPIAVSPRKGGKTRQSRKADLSILIFKRLKLIVDSPFPGWLPRGPSRIRSSNAHGAIGRHG